MVVDDSVVIRRLVTHALEQDPEIEVVGTASNGFLGLNKIAQLNPDVLTLDIEMPGMDGLQMLRTLRQDFPNVRVIMFSTLTERGAAVTLEALTLGADDYITKASNEGSIQKSMSRLREEMIPKVKQFFRTPGATQERKMRIDASAARLVSAAAPATSVKSKPEVVVIGISTGGPTALGTILPELPAEFPLPVLVVQHMPPLFTRLLAERLNSTCALQVHEAHEGDEVEKGKILIAPGDYHMRVVSDRGARRIALDQDSPENFCRPAVDVLFRSAGQTYGGAALAVVLTGMGQDGLRGTEVLKANGCTVLAQDEATSVVWGMPGAVANAGLADQILPLDQVVPAMLRMVEGN